MNINFSKKTVVAALISSLLLGTAVVHAQTATAIKPVDAEPKVIEMTFVLDTTGSMGGLIEGAKTKIWHIINDVMQKQGKAAATSVKVGLVAYRDRGDEYVTKITPLSENLDEVYRVLMDYKAAGGGDTPEDVRMALRDGVEKAGWSKPDKNVSQIIFLVGDAPPHDNYKDVPPTQESVKKARQRGMVVNTIQAGVDKATTAAWHSIAQHGGGEYFAIAQDGGVRAVATPYDVELSDLGSKMGSTYVAYGSAGARVSKKEAQVSMEAKVSAAAPATAKADRAVNKAINSKAYDDADLIQSVENKSVELERIKTEELPDEMQKMSAEERKVYVDKQIAERKVIKERIVDLSHKRDAYIAEQNKKSAGKEDGFDTAVSTALGKQIK